MRGKGMLGGLNRGHWQPQEDLLLKKFIEANGVERWSTLPAKAGLNRCGKSCRFRWMNYLRPNVKRGDISEDEKDLITKLHKLLGNRWSLIAARVPGRTDNDVKNFWNSQCRNKCFKKAKSISETNDLLHITPSPSKTLGQEESHGTLSDIKESCNGIIGDIQKGSNEILSDLQETPSQYLFDVLLDSEFLRFGCVPWLDSNNREIFECNYVFDSNPISQIDLMDIMC